MKSAHFVHEEHLLKMGFTPCKCLDKYNASGICYELDSDIGKGNYWLYTYEDLFAITIHDFSFYHRFYLESFMDEYLGITYYESISGEEIDSYKILKPNCVKGFFSDEKGYRAVIQPHIPVKSIGIEIMPKYYNQYLADKYPGEFEHPKEAFTSIDESTNFPEMILLLKQIEHYKNTGISAKLFYEGKVSEAISLIIEKSKQKKDIKKKAISPQDSKQIKLVTDYLDNHFLLTIPQDDLCHLACMGKTKLKNLFKQTHQCTITEYIQNKRILYAEHMLQNTNLTIQQIAMAVGYTSHSRFSSLFKLHTGLLPNEYRKHYT